MYVQIYAAPFNSTQYQPVSEAFLLDNVDYFAEVETFYNNTFTGLSVPVIPNTQLVPVYYNIADLAVVSGVMGYLGGAVKMIG